MSKSPLSRRTSVLAALTTLSLLGLSAVGPAQAVNFGSLNITPRGAQNLNLETGATDLPEGGTATDARSGMKLTAARMQVRPGQTLSAQDATITTRQGGTLQAAQVVYDLKGGTVVASGGATYRDSRFNGLSAPAMALYVKSGFVTAGGGVKAQSPALSASGMVFDPSTMQVLLTGPASVTQGSVRASAPAGGRLVLVFAGNRLLRAATPDNATLARFRPYLK